MAVGFFVVIAPGNFYTAKWKAEAGVSTESVSGQGENKGFSMNSFFPLGSGQGNMSGKFRRPGVHLGKAGEGKGF